MKILDSHVHFIDPLRPEGVSWPARESPLHRQCLPGDLIRDSEQGGPTACVVVETGRRPVDDEWLAALASAEPLVAGVVLNLQPDMPDFAGRLEKHLNEDKFIGVRFRPVDEYDLASATLSESVELLAKAGKSIEFGAKSCAQKREFARLASEFPGTTWILDHCGHPPHDAEPGADWSDGIAAIASLPNTGCKVTGEFGFDARWRPVLATLQRAFGPQRLLYGSNWPVCRIPNRFAEAVQSLATVFGEHAKDFFHENAKRAYKI